MNLLYLAAFVPDPIRDGDIVRARFTLTALAKRHRIYGFFLDPTGRGIIPPVIQRLVTDAVAVPVAGMAWRGIRAALSGRTAHAYAFHAPAARAAFGSAISRWPVDAAFVHRIRMMPFLEALDLPYVLDATDCLGEYYRRATGLQGWRRAYAALDGPRVARAERAWGNRSKGVLAITRAERDRFRAEGVRAPIHVVPNGLDTGFWSGRPDLRSRNLVFVGNLDYPPNRQGLAWFLRDVAPRIGRADVGLSVVGGGNTAPFRDLVRSCGLAVRFHGFRPEIRDHLKRAAMAVCPLPLAAGLQNKAVQAMSCRTPVVATPNVARAIGAVAGRDLLAGSTPAAFAAACRLLLDRPVLRRGLGESGRRVVARRFGMPVAERALHAAVAALGAGR